MLRVKGVFVLLFMIFVQLAGQVSILHQEDIMTEVKKGLVSTYNYQFENARQSLAIIKKKAPEHPATFFLESLIIYWENYPMTLENSNSAKFLSLVEESYTRAEKMLVSDPENLEGIFFDLFAKAFYVMYWADVGKPGKVFSYLNPLYKLTVKGFELQDSFNEFTFTTGLYNYYIVAYPENHPAYRAVALLFKKGDKEYGLEQLHYCSQNSVFLRVEAKFYLSLIYLKYQNNYRKASEYASALYREFPNNHLFAALYAEILMLDNKFMIAEVLIRNLENSKSSFAKMNGHILRAYYLEKYERKYSESFTEYKKGLEMSLKYGELTRFEAARAHMGMGRQYQRTHRNSDASRSFRAAKGFTNYEYVLNDK